MSAQDLDSSVGGRKAQADWVELQACTICGKDDHRPFDSVGQGADAIKYRVCNNCGVVYQSPRMSEASLQAYYQADYVMQHQAAQGVTEKELRIQAGRARNLVRLIQAHRTMVERHLDIGSSAGLLMEAVARRYGCASVGVELAQVYRTYASGKGLTVYPTLDELAERKEMSFELITMAHVLEHLPDPVRYLSKLRLRWLSEDGNLLIEVPNLYGHFSYERPHLFCFSAASLRRTLGEAGFKPLQMITHGAPRSRLIPLYLTVIAGPLAQSEPASAVNSRATGVALRRKLGMTWHRFITRLAPRRAWLPFPELDDQ